jgi:hypothetical protein
MYQHPLNSYLYLSPDSGAFVLEYPQQPFDAEQLRAGLSEKLNRLHYPQPAHEHLEKGKTFAQILENAGVLPDLLSEDTLRELWKSLALKNVLERSRELSDKKQSVLGVPLKEHSRIVREIQKDIDTLKTIADKYELKNTLLQLDKMSRKSMDELITIFLSGYLSGRRVHGRQLLIFTLPVPEWKTNLPRRGRRRLPKSSAPRRVPKPRIEDTRIQALIYQTLEQRLQNPTTYQNGIDDIFLCQLAELVWAPADVRQLSDGESLRRDINRLRT